MTGDGRPLLEVENLEKTFPVQGGFFSRRKGFVHAVCRVSFELQKGETLGFVGESGCGKTTLGLCILRLLEPTAGRVLFAGEELLSLSGARLQALRRRMQIIFQDPFGSLDPQWTVERIVGEGLSVHGIALGSEREDRVASMLKKVGLDPSHRSRHPDEFSGGQRQRIGIARSLILNPELIVCDEPLSALDVSIQAQILNLLTSLQKELHFSYLMISHDLSMVKYVSDRVAVMYLGKIIEIARSRDIYRQARHPYTQALLSAIPVPDPAVKKERILLRGELPNPIHPPPGCRFHTRCWRKKELCTREEPPLREVGPAHLCACHLQE
ncbi:MAG: ATP-binding cassette domain-containing protein [Deltaproteobacteria bacterium]|nr:ATP-binding cassette domain-containing protein [Deltaproteobacteria bacterium]